MAASSSDYRPLLSAGLWLAAVASALVGWYGLAESSSIGLALALELALVAVAAWVVRDLHRKRDFTPDAPSPESPATTDLAAGPLRKDVQTPRIVLACTAALVGLVALFQLLQQALGGAPGETGGMAFGAVCLAGAFVWLVLARALQAIPRADLPEAEPLSFAFREAQWASLVAAIGLMGGTFHPPLALWVGRGLFVWALAVCTETLLRQIVPLLIPLEPGKDFAPSHLLLREVLFATGNPVGNLLRTVESRYGVGLRSSWAITFLKRAALPLLAFLLLLFWASTSLVIVEMGHLGVREHFGRLAGQPLTPGLHVKLPWPCGQIRSFSVKTVHQVPIGFVEGDQPANFQGPRALLWTRDHAKEEFSLVLGDGTELVVVNALLYYKIDEDARGFLDYVYGQSTAEEALTAFAYRALTEQTRGRTLDEVLSADRADFARRLVGFVRRQAKEARLGLEVVDLALLNLHPPIQAAGSYLDVINARLDARRRVTEAEGKMQVALLSARERSASAVATARVEASRRLAEASSQVGEFTVVGGAPGVAPETFRLRLWIEALEKALAGQRLFLIDETLLGEGGELLLDTRRYPNTPLPSLGGMSSSVPPGAKKP